MYNDPSTPSAVDTEGGSNSSKRKKRINLVTTITILVGILAILAFLGITNIRQLVPCGVSLQFDCGTEATPTSTPVPPPPVLVQYNSSQPGSTTLNKVTFKNPVQPGDLIVVAITQDITGIKGQITDNHNDSFLPVVAGPAVFANPQDTADFVELYYAKNVAGGSTTVTVTFTQPPANSNYGGDSNLGIYEFSHLSHVAPLDHSGSATGGSQSGNPDQSITLTGPSLAASEVNDVCFAVGVDSGLNNSNDKEINAPVVAGSGFMLLDQQDDSVDYERFYAEYQVLPIGSSVCQPMLAMPYDSYWAVVGATFKH